MTVQIAAASSALILGEEKRDNGRWLRGSVPLTSGSGSKQWAQRVAECGLVLDVLGRDGLRRVRDEELSLNAAYEQAVEARDAGGAAVGRQLRVPSYAPPLPAVRPRRPRCYGSVGIGKFANTA